MRFVYSIPPVISPVEEGEPWHIRAVRPVRPVEPRNRVPLVIQHFGRKVKAEEAPSGPALVRLEKRGGDRREWCRRLQRDNALLNTRSGVERRKNKRRSNDVATTLNEEG